MHCVRRAALRSAIAASRQLSQKAAPAPFAVQATSKPALPKQIHAAPARFFSLTTRARNAEETTNAETAAAETDVNAPKQGLDQAPLERRTRLIDPSPYAVFVSNVTFDADDEHLTHAFSKYGEVVEARIARDGAGLPRGYGFVFYKNEESVQDAIDNCDGTFWHGRQIRVQAKARRNRERRPSASEPTLTLYIGGIPQDATDSDLNHFFRGLKNVKEVRVAVDRTTGWPRGFAHVDFSDVESAIAAKSQLEGAQFGKRYLTLDFATGSARKKGDAKKD